MDVKALKTLFFVIGLMVSLFSPLLLIWAINTLFDLKVPYSMETWAAVLVLIFFYQVTRINAHK